MTADPHTVNSAPRNGLSAPLAASTPLARVSRPSGPLNGPQTGAQSLCAERQGFNEPDAPDCDPSWTDTWQPGEHTPTPFDLRQQEMHDLRDQRAGPVALWTATTIQTEEYL